MRRNNRYRAYHGNEKRITYNWVCIIICKKATCDYVDHSLYHSGLHICNELSLNMNLQISEFAIIEMQMTGLIT